MATKFYSVTFDLEASDELSEDDVQDAVCRGLVKMPAVPYLNFSDVRVELTGSEED